VSFLANPEEEGDIQTRSGHCRIYRHRLFAVYGSLYRKLHAILFVAVLFQRAWDSRIREFGDNAQHSVVHPPQDLIFTADICQRGITGEYSDSVTPWLERLMAITYLALALLGFICWVPEACPLGPLGDLRHSRAVAFRYNISKRYQSFR
jgi:hypothetical protein